MTQITRVPVIALAAGLSAIALLAGCSAGSSSAGTSSGGGSSAGFSARAGFSASSAGGRSASSAAGQQPVARPAAPDSGQPAAQAARLIPAQSIIYTASLTVQVSQVAAAAQRAAGLAAAAGGYTASESESSQRGRGRQVSSARLQLKIPVAAYPATLAKLRSDLGTQTALQQQAQDVTEQIADVTSRVGSAQAAITQLRALLRRAGTVASLLSVQDEINSQESALEALQAQQRVLAHQTTFATVSLLLVSHHLASVRKTKEHGFIPGLAAGWRGLRTATSWVLTTIGTILPFILILALAGGIGYAGRQRLLRRRTRPTTAE
jgi:hypothetical protein